MSPASLRASACPSGRNLPDFVAYPSAASALSPCLPQSFVHAATFDKCFFAHFENSFS